ncbi:MAG: endolytic transglycosylase MltG [Lachnospiraceae bacterium]|nr:endolytic transglycosylase MltG [Lachnospiraceae bacterium]
MEQNKAKKVKIIIVAIVVLALLIIGTPVIWYNVMIQPVSTESEKVSVEVKLGTTVDSIAQMLKDSNLIKSKEAFKIYVKLNNLSDFQAGKYELYKNMTLEEIAKSLQSGKVYKDNQLAITFIEGKNIRGIAETIENNTNNTKEDVYETLKDEEYLDSLIEKYWFITDEIKNPNIYYSLEGYLYPDTYFFENEDVKVEEIFKVMLDKMEEVLEKYKEEYQNELAKKQFTMHQILTIASIIETEGIYDSDRKDISSVIYNRLKQRMAIGSDVTTYYAAKIEIGERDLRVSELKSNNPYNTRGPNMEGKLPVGPIASVAEASIEAALNPNDTDYLFFVADKNGKVYFTKTDAQHNAKIDELRANNLWFEF